VITMRALRRRLRALLARPALDRDLDDEIRFHLQMETDDLARLRGLPRDEAERQARLRFGGVDRYRESHRDARGVRTVQEFVADTFYAARTLRRAPAFALSTVLVLALGIGASTAIFSAVNAVLLSRLPYPDDDRLVRVYQRNSPTNQWPLSVVDYRAIEAQATTLTGFGAFVVRDVPVSTGRIDPARMRVTPATAGLFTTLGINVASAVVSCAPSRWSRRRRSSSSAMRSPRVRSAVRSMRSARRS
jgi:putative ABC transport system permease protein